MIGIGLSSLHYNVCVIFAFLCVNVHVMCANLHCIVPGREGRVRLWYYLCQVVQQLLGISFAFSCTSSIFFAVILF